MSINNFSPVRIICQDCFFGALRRGNKPPVLPGEDKRAERSLASPCQGRWIFAVGKKTEG